jgi:hypothetical protein
MGWTIWGSNPVTGQRYISFQLRPVSVWGPFTLLLNRYPALLGIGRLACEVGHTSPSSAEVKNGWSSTWKSPVYIHCVGRDKFNFTLPVGQEVTEVCRKVLHEEFRNYVLL